MSFASRKIFRSLPLALLLSLGVARISFGAEANGLSSTLKAAGYSEVEILPVIKKAGRNYSAKYTQEHFQWLWNQGIRDRQLLLDTLPTIMSQSIADDLEPKVGWLKDQGIEDLGKLEKGLPHFLDLSLENDIKPKTRWLQEQGIKDVGLLISKAPQVLKLPVAENLAPKLAEMKDQWGIGIAEIDKYPRLLAADLSNVQKLRLFLDEVAQLAGDSHFDLSKLTSEQRRALIWRGSPKEIIESLQMVKAIDPKRKSLPVLTKSERTLVAELYRSGKLQELLSHMIQMGGPQKPQEIVSYVTHLRKEWFDDSKDVPALLQSEEFAWIERKRLLEFFDNRFSARYVKTYIHWLKSYGVTNTEQLTDAMLLLVGNSIKDNLEPKIAWLKEQGIQDIGRILGDHPAFLRRPLETNLKPKVAWLREHGVQDLNKPMRLYSDYLDLSLEHQFKPVLAWLESQGVQDTAKLLNNYPPVFGRSIERHLEPRVAWLKSQGFKDIGALIANYPPILQSSIEENLAPKFIELKTYWGIGIAEIEKTPMMLMSSLPRIQGVRRLLDDMAKLAKDSQFDLTRFTASQRQLLVQKISASDIFQRLKDIGAISTERTNLAELTSSERSIVAKLYRENSDFIQLISSASESLARQKKLAAFVKTLKKRSPDNAPEHTAWLKKAGVKDPEQVLKNFPAFYGYSIEDNLNPTAAWLKKNGVKNLGKLAKDAPEVFGLSISNLESKVEWLKKNGVKDIGKLFDTAPQIVSNPIELLEKKVAWLKEHGVVDTTKPVGSNPTLLGYSIENNFEPKLAWLKRQGVEDIGKVISSSPQIFAYSIENNLEPKVAWLREQGFQNIGKLIESFPQVLGLSIPDNLGPKLIEFKTHWQIGIAEVEKSPGLLIASLARVQEARHFLDEIAIMAGASHFDVTMLSSAQTKDLIQSLSAAEIFQRLKDVGAISHERHNLSDLTPHERSVVAEFYNQRELPQLFSASGRFGPQKRQKVSCYISLLRAALSIP